MTKTLRQSTKLFSIILAVALVAGGVLVSTSQSATDNAQIIRITERPGYFETHGDIFHIKPGAYNFVVTNEAGKDAGFVISRTGQKDEVILVKEGQTNNLRTKLKSGEYEYYCPIIPTAKYKIIVD